MWPLFLLQVQAASAPAAPRPESVTPYLVLAAENQREAGVPVLTLALQSGDTVVQRLAVRAIGRLKLDALAPALTPMLRSRAVSVRVQAVRAAALLRSPLFLSVRTSESDTTVRAAILEAIGSLAGADSLDRALTVGLDDASLGVRRGAARGLEGLLRRNGQRWKPSTDALVALRRTVQQTTDPELRLVSLLALTAARDRDGTTIAAALTDTNPEVRRAAVALGRSWVNDPHPMVRWQAMSVAPSCERAAAALRDPSEHVALLAIDQVGTLACAASLLTPFLASSTPWRPRAHATVALARLDAATAAPAIHRLALSPVWQARAWAAQAARITHDGPTLESLSHDPAPNVAIEAMTSRDEAFAALGRDHAGLLRAAAAILEKERGTWSPDDEARVRSAFDRVSQRAGPTWRDARTSLLKLVRTPTGANLLWLAERLRDADPQVGDIAEAQLAAYGLPKTLPAARTLRPPPFPTEAQLTAERAATATITIRGKGVVVLRLDSDEAPMAAYTFATLARAGRYRGNTIHRIVPNFVVQGGSPGADEYDPVTNDFMRDEVGGRNLRGTFGISTRGYDTGDGQLYINLVNNLRLDNDYTVFASIVSGLDVVDRIQEGDVIQSVVITSKAPARAALPLRRRGAP